MNQNFLGIEFDTVVDDDLIGSVFDLGAIIFTLTGKTVRICVNSNQADTLLGILPHRDIEDCLIYNNTANIPRL